MLNDVLKSFSALQPAPGITFEIIIVDNNSVDNTRDIVRQWQSHDAYQIHYFLEKKQGSSHARNRAVNEAKGTWLWFLDDDIYLDEYWLQAVAESLREYPDAMAMAGMIMLEFERTEPEWLPEVAKNYYGMTRFGDNPRVLKHKEYPIAANAAIRREVFDQIGLFNSELGRVGCSLISWDETELFMRLHMSGSQIIYTPHVIVRHRITKQRLTKLWLIRRIFSDGISQVIAEGNNITRNRKELYNCAMDRLRIIYTGLCILPFSFENQLKYIREFGCFLQYMVHAVKAHK
jgi:GT2 family glycosyltransferase